MNGPPTILEELTDPQLIARSQAQHERAHQNSDWLQSHWSQLLPRAYAKHVAVAGQEAFIAETAEAALALARAAHPDDDGVFVQYVLPPQGPRLYGNQGILYLGGGWSGSPGPSTGDSDSERPTADSAVSGR
jgi:hypothetical protein